jgi:lysophospholipase-2
MEWKVNSELRDCAEANYVFNTRAFAEWHSLLPGIVDQFQSAHKLPHMHWILPNAIRNNEVGATAWFTPKATKLEKGEDEDESGMLESVAYIESLIEACRNKGIPESRIVLGGFSQGCAISLLTDLVSRKYSGRLAGIVGLMGQLPLADGRRVDDLRAHAGLQPTTGEVPIFLARGRKDHLIDCSRWTLTLEKLATFQGTAIETKEYANLGHSLDGQVLSDVCKFLERIVPSLED